MQPPTLFIVIKRAAGLLVSLIVTTPFVQGDTILVGPSTRNGSFEDGVLSPWSAAVNDASVLNDSSFASDGDWCARLSEAATSSSVRPSIFLTLNANRTDGLDFLLTLDARNGATAFSGLRVFFAAQNSDTSYAFATNSFLTPISDEWQAFALDFRLPEAWDGGGNLYLGLQYENQSAVVGLTYSGYLDNVLLQQIPEPSELALFSLGGGLLFAAWLRKRKSLEQSPDSCGITR
jgi:hypothetical protein